MNKFIEKKTVAVSGATGFIGSALCKTLGSSAGYICRPLCRSDGYVLENVSPEVWREGFNGSRTCIHLASMLPWNENNFDNTKQDIFNLINAYASREILRAFAASGGHHFVFLSTIGVNGVTSGERPFTPYDQPNAEGNYSKSKLLAEQFLEEDAERLKIKLTIFRPPLVYGKGAGGSFARLVSQVRSARVLPYKNINNHRDMIGLRNLVDLLIATLDQETCGTFLIKDRDSVSTTQLVQSIARLNKSKCTLISIPLIIRKVMQQLPFTRSVARRLFDDVRIDDSKFAQMNSWQPRYSVQDELEFMFCDLGNKSDKDAS